MMRILRILSRHVFIPLLERRANGSTFKCLKELEKTQWLPKDELKRLQEEQLQRMMPWYRSEGKMREKRC